jgi:hypothetical protein
MAYTRANVHLALLAHVMSHNMRAVSDTFRWCNSPLPRIPNMNENRSHNNTLGSLRFPPPAANWNRASSTAQISVFVLLWQSYLKLSWLYYVLNPWMCRVGCFTLGAKGRIECTHHLWCRCITVSGLETTELPKYKKIVTSW